MAIHVALSHVTTYRYDRWVALSPQLVRLRPAPHCRTPILSYSLRVTPEPALPQLAAGPAEQLPRAARLPGEGARAARRGRPRRRDGGLQPVRLLPRARRPSTFPFAYDDVAGARAAARILAHRAADAALRRLSRRRQPRSRAARIDFLVDAEPARAARRRATSSASSPACRRRRRRSTLGRGSCRDSAWLLVQLLRHLGPRRALRLRLPDPARRRTCKPLDGPAGPERDFTDLHAWCEVYLPGRRLDRPRPDVGPARRRRAHPARLHARARRAPRRSPARVDECEVDVRRTRCRCSASTSRRA